MPVKTKTKLLLAIAVATWLIMLAGMIVTAVFLAKHLTREKPEPEPGTIVTEPAPESILPENPYGPEDFAYVNDFLTCTAGPSVLGIDVSSHQKQIDWQKVKEAGIEFVMIRLAYRGSIEGALIPDEMAQEYYRGAKEAGLKVGGYIFTQAITVEEALEDAAYVLELSEGWELDMPLVYDWEIIDKSYRNGNLDKDTLTQMMLAFCGAIEDAGHQAMVYFNKSNVRDNFYLEQLAEYGLWLANYRHELDFAYRIDMWQYTCEGSVPGIEVDVDINLYFPYD